MNFKKLFNVVLVVILVAMSVLPTQGVKANSVIETIQWPTNWYAYTDKNNNQILDIAGEVSPSDTDITSGADKGYGKLPSVYVGNSDGDTLFLRFRMKANPYDRKGGFLSTAWVVKVIKDINGTPTQVATIGLDGKSPSEDYVYVTNGNGSKLKKIFQTDGSGHSVPGTQITPDGNGHYFLDIQVPVSEIAAISDAADIVEQNKVMLYFGTSKAANLSVINKEWMMEDKGYSNLKEFSLENPGADLGNSNPVGIDAPELEISSLTGEKGTDGFFASNNIDVTGTVSEDLPITIEVNGSSIGSTINPSSGNWSVNLSSYLPDSSGNYQLVAYIVDDNGVKVKAETDFVVSKSVSEAVTIDGGTVAKSTISNPLLSGTYKTANQGNSIYVFVNNTELGEASKINSNTGWQYQLPAGALKEGINNIKVEIRSNKSVFSSTTQQLRYIPPNSTVTLPVSVSIDSVTPSGSATPVLTGNSTSAKTVEVQIVDSANHVKTIERIEPALDGQWSTTIERPLSADNYTVRVIAVNPSNDEVAIDSVNYSVNQLAITIDNGTGPLTINNNTPTIRGNTNATNGTNVEIFIGDHGPYTATVKDGRWEFPVPMESPLADGSYTVTATVTENESTVTATQDLSIKASTSITILNPEFNASITDTLRPVISGTTEENENININLVVTNSNSEAEAVIVESLSTENGQWDYIPVSDLTDGTYTVSATATDAYGNVKISNSVFTLSQATLPLLTGVSISGVAKYGETLTINEITYGSTALNDIPTYQWNRNGEAISGATNSSYTLAKEDIGKHITVTVTADGANATGRATSTGAEVVLKADGPEKPQAPVEDTKTTTSIKLMEEEGQEYSIVGSDSWQDFGEFTGLTPDTEYTFVTRVKETETHKPSEISDPTKIKTAEIAALPEITGVSITGTHKYNSTLKATDVTYSSNPSGEVSLSYTWMRNREAISGATSDTYLLGKEDIGKQISVMVTADGTNAAGSATSDPTEAIAIDLELIAQGSSNGEGIVTVNGALPGELVTLLNNTNTAEGTPQRANELGFVQFENVPLGLDYYVVQNINGVQIKSNYVDVTVSRVEIVGSTDGIGTIKVEGAYPDAIVKLYDKDGNYVTEATADQNGKVVFTSISPGIDYYVIQSASGIQSPKSNKINVFQLFGSDDGQKTVTGLGATPGATVKLYSKQSKIVASAVADVDGKVSFTNVNTDIDYYVVQTVGEVTSVPSNKVNVYPRISVRFSEGDIWESVTKTVFVVKESSEGSIEWVSSNEDVINFTESVVDPNAVFPEYIATVTRQTKDVNVIVTANIKRGDQELHRTFLLVVKGTAEEEEKITNPSGNKVKLDGVEQQTGFGQDVYVTRTLLKRNGVSQFIDKMRILSGINSNNQTNIIEFDDTPSNTGVRADEIAAEIVFDALETMKSKPLTIKTPEGSITLGKDALEEASNRGIDLFFRIVPIREQQGIAEVIDRTKRDIQSNAGQSKIATILGIPREIHTNYSGIDTKVTLPLTGINLQQNELGSLRVFIEHSDGTKHVVVPGIDGTLEYANGVEQAPTGLTFTISKFSTFTFYKISDIPPSNGGGDSSPQIDFTGAISEDMRTIELEFNQTIGSFQKEGLTVVVASKEIEIEDVSVSNDKRLIIKLRDSLPVGTDVFVNYDAQKGGANERLERLKMYKLQMVGHHLPYIKGFQDGTFKPNTNITRAQMAAMLSRNLGVDEKQNKVEINPYKDVDKGYWAAGAIEYLAKKGLMKGDNNGKFNPSAKITRAEMAVIVARYKQLEVEAFNNILFSDISGHWAAKEIAANKEAGVITGFSDGTFRPNSALTRAEAVKMINRMFDRGPLYGMSLPSWSDVPSSHWAFHEIEEASKDHTFTLRTEGGETINKK